MIKVFAVLAILFTSIRCEAEVIPKTMSNAEALAYFSGLFVGMAEDCGADPNVVSEFEITSAELIKTRAKTEQEVSSANELHIKGRNEGKKEGFPKPPVLVDKCNPESATAYLQDLKRRSTITKNAP